MANSKAAKPVRPYLADPQECALLMVLLVQAKEHALEREMTRALVSEITLKRLWGRRRLEDDFLRAVQDWLFRTGWALFDAGATYALIRTKTVEGWPRLSSKRLKTTLKSVARGEFDFTEHVHWLLDEESAEDDREEA